ncbi:hypothetical protein MHM98_11930 [Psychrobium sp. MM17-31]|uniref:hypothetical protein n=1 Tax=Psychrobium sp. MM17-31 TaxID=2917758 RepID=UPI001EF56FA8|nr:hypothetical protein [Psychrobium sp. MM17-31]MCG7532045.1 hypothetical protein [Psychrobium sp. MM17-31]
MVLKIKYFYLVIFILVFSGVNSKELNKKEFSSRVDNFKSSIPNTFNSYNERFIEINDSYIYTVELVKKGIYSRVWCYYYIDPVKIVKKQERPIKLTIEKLMVAQKKANECGYIEGNKIPRILGTSFESIEEFKIIQEEFYVLFNSETFTTELRSNYPLDYNDIKNSTYISMRNQGNGRVEVYIPVYKNRRLRINLEFRSKRLIVKSLVFSKGAL